VKRQFMYPADGYDSDKCKGHTLYVVGKALRNFGSMLNKEYMEKWKTPFEDYSFITHDIWEEFVMKHQTKEAKGKGEKFSELTKRNQLHHHLGMIGYAAKKEQWWWEEREAAEARQPNPL